MTPSEMEAYATKSFPLMDCTVAVNPSASVKIPALARMSLSCSML